ncbi:pirin family protein [Tundrisphaera lichenicola]|uniref:pirin family protein n=1 Tax=Tundrisphaera lichenicola TaxID=2029860 RepID=UPI003EBFA082
MSIRVLRSGDRGHFDHGWLDTYHTFSFGDYYNPRRMSYRSLRVMNEDRFGPGTGFGMHSHHDMEILTYVLSGTLEHRDSLGNGGPILPGELQRMTAGTGIAHSERNGSSTEPVHLYQIWLLPARKGLTPGYEQKAFEESGRQGQWQVVASVDGRDGSLTIHQDASLYLAKLEPSDRIGHEVAPGRQAWLQVLRGQVEVGGETLQSGDGAEIDGGSPILIEGKSSAEVLLFDLG